MAKSFSSPTSEHKPRLIPIQWPPVQFKCKFSGKILRTGSLLQRHLCAKHSPTNFTGWIQFERPRSTKMLCIFRRNLQNINHPLPTAADTEVRSSSIQLLPLLGCRMESLWLSGDVQRKFSFPNSQGECNTGEWLQQEQLLRYIKV